MTTDLWYKYGKWMTKATMHIYLDIGIRELNDLSAEIRSKFDCLTYKSNHYFYHLNVL